MDAPQELTVSDKQSVTWLRLKALLEQRLDELRRENDRDLNADDTAMVRGRIKEVKRLLGIDKELPKISGSVPTY